MKIRYEVIVEFDEEKHPKYVKAFDDIADALQDGYGFPEGVTFTAKRIES